MTIPPPPAPAPGAATPAAVTAHTRRPSWWRRNRLALIALAVLVPATALGIGWFEWYQFYGYDARPFRPVAVDEGGTAELGGATWGPVRAVEVTDTSGFDVPDGSTLIGVAVPVDADEAGVWCPSPRLVQQQTGREWESVRWEIGLKYNPDEPEKCVSDETAPYELIVPFVVPDDVEGPFWVDVWPEAAGASFLRFVIDP